MPNFVHVLFIPPIHRRAVWESARSGLLLPLRLGAPSMVPTPGSCIDASVRVSRHRARRLAGYDHVTTVRMRHDEETSARLNTRDSWRTWGRTRQSPPQTAGSTTWSATSAIEVTRRQTSANRNLHVLLQLASRNSVQRQGLPGPTTALDVSRTGTVILFTRIQLMLKRLTR